MEAPLLNTDRLVLRPFTMDDAADVTRLAGDRAVADTTLTIPHPYEGGMAEKWISSHRPAFEAGEEAVFAVTLRENGWLLGAVGLTIERRFGRAELGYWIGVPFWGLGYCTEAADAVLRFSFMDLGLHRVFARHFLRNPASGRVMEKLGMTREGVLRGHEMKWDRLEDVVVYGILRDEWVCRERPTGNDVRPAVEDREAVADGLTAYCGISCIGCPVRWATMEADPEKQARLRVTIASTARMEHGMDMETDDVTDCFGCVSETGGLLPSCLECGIRRCAGERRLESCAACGDYPCTKLQAVFMIDPAAKHRLDVLRHSLYH